MQILVIDNAFFTYKTGFACAKQQCIIMPEANQTIDHQQFG